MIENTELRDLFGGDYHSRDERILLSFKAIGGGIWDYQVAEDRLYCDQRWYEIMGIDGRSHPVENISDLRKYIHPEDADKATVFDLSDIRKLIGRDERYQVDFRIIQPGGAIRWIRSVATVLRDASRRLRAIGCIIDITEFHAASRPEKGVPALARDALASPAATHVTLTSKEKECLFWVSLGKTAWETAAILDRSPRTVEFHLANAIRKLDAANKIHAVAIAIRNRLL